MKRGSRADCVKALAYCVESLCATALADACGAIRSALSVDDRIWDHLNSDTIDILENGLGYKRPPSE